MPVPLGGLSEDFSFPGRFRWVESGDLACAMKYAMGLVLSVLVLLAFEVAIS